MLFNHSILTPALLATSTIVPSEEGLVEHNSFSSKAYSAIAADFKPANFFDNFNFFTDKDPTHGFVHYIDRTAAAEQDFINTASTHAFIGVDHKNIASPTNGRQSVRIVSKQSFTHGLFLLDASHLPFGCGTWPAFWTVGPNWPSQGEIDIIEGVNNQNWNNMALHTSPGCTITGAGATSAFAFSDCDTSVNGNSGCGFHNTNTQSYGQGFNNNGGGLYAMEWNSDFIKIWFFPRNAIPADALGAHPEPANWGAPAGFFQGCDIDQHFSGHQIVIDTTFCGDWAGNVWSSQCSSLGATCASYVQNHPSAFTDAYWIINSLRVFSS